MATTDALQLVQIGDVALYGHINENALPSVDSLGSADEGLDSYRVIIPHAPLVVKVRKWAVRGVLYASHGRSRAQIINQLQALTNRVTDVIAVEFIDNDSDTLDPYPKFAATGTTALWLHNRGRIVSLDIDGKGINLDFQINLELFSFWQPLNPAIWIMKRRTESMPRFFRKAAFESNKDIVALPEPKTFFQLEVPYSFQKRIYENQGFHYEPEYFLALQAQHDRDLPLVRYASDWQVSVATGHDIFIDKARWSAPPLSVYLFKELTSATTIEIIVESESGVWEISEIISSIDVSVIQDAMIDSGYSLVDSDILVVGDVEHGAFILRDGETLIHVADAVSRTGGSWAGQLQPGQNLVKVHGAMYAQHHVFRRL